ncbi:unnamed protein product [Cylicocyclus nassatus]|uniref:SCP domain-containing protein n=1 Tax=Cylicocyclus nassatus TaxID=53992 RepID=A0AA36GNL9_CYLNA|nr:unnamed protein product [Cylicocyclus nassatus]
MHKKPWSNQAGMIKVRYSCELEHYAARDSRWCIPYELKTSACVEVLRTKIPMAQVHTSLSAIKQMLNGWKTAVGCAVNGCDKHGGYWNVVCRYATICTPKSRKLYNCFNGKRCEKHKRPRKTKLLPEANKFMVNFTSGYVYLLD